MTTRCAFKIEDPSRGPGRVDFKAPDEGFASSGPRNLRSGGTLPQKKETLYVVRRCIAASECNEAMYRPVVESRSRVKVD